MDVLSDVLKTVRLEGALFLHGEFREPWCVEVPAGPALAHRVLGSERQICVVHVVLEGRLWARLPKKEPIPLEAGDAIVLPQGELHRIGSGLQFTPASIDHLVETTVPDLSGLRYGGDGERSVVVCGWFSTESELPNPLTSALPGMFVTSMAKRPSGTWLEQSLRFALKMNSSNHPGSEILTAKVAETLFVELLRGYIESLPDSGTGWFCGLRDPLVGRCLALLHGEPAVDWTVDELAKRVHSSRSVVSQRFADLLGVAPIQYLTSWRLALASRILSDEHCTIGEAAQRVGYGSEAAFNRAFKREFGMAPGKWRQRKANPDSASEEDSAKSL